MPRLAWNFWAVKIFLLCVVVPIFISTRSSRGSQILSSRLSWSILSSRATLDRVSKTAKPNCLRFSVSVVKHHSQKQLVEERFYFVYSSTARSIGEGRQDKNLEAGTEGQTTEESYLLAFASCGLTACFLRAPRSTSPGVAAPLVPWVLSHQLVNQ